MGLIAICIRLSPGAALSVALLTLLSCTSPGPEKSIGEEVPDEHALLALEAYRGKDRYFLRYRRGDE